MTDPLAPPSRRGARLLLALATVAVGFAAADTYVVVLALPEMMGSVGLSIEELQRAAPIVSGFLLGYVAMLPLIGRVADLHGRVPVLGAALVLFGLGSLVTAAAYDLPSLVAGRFLQGIGGGGLVPVTLALVADLYPVERRGVPLGVVGAVQELGSVLGPLFGAAVLTVADWRAIFWINLAGALLLAAAVRQVASSPSPARPRRRPDGVGALLLLLWLTALLLVMTRPRGLVTSVQWGAPFVPFGGTDIRWWSPIGITAVALGLILVGWLWWGPSRIVDLRIWWRALRASDLPGAALLATALGGVVLAFATADPTERVLAEAGPWYLGVAVVAVGAFVLHQRHASDPLVPAGAVRHRPAWGAMLVSLFIGAALIAALVDIPTFARLTIHSDSQIRAALVLVEFLVALPVGALAGGYLTRMLPTGLIAFLGMAGAAAGFWVMSTWSVEALSHPASAVVLAGTGLGFGLAVAPVNAALLAATEASVHGLASALLVVARMVGMLVGVSALTTIGLRRYYTVSADFPAPAEVCDGATRCQEYTELLQGAGIQQLQAIFGGAAGCAAAAAVLALFLFHGAPTRVAARDRTAPSTRSHGGTGRTGDHR